MTADVFGLGPDVHDQPRRRDPGGPEHVFGALVGGATAGSDSVGVAGAAEVISVGERGADGVGVGIAVPEDKKAHEGVLRGSGRPHGESGQAGAKDRCVLLPRGLARRQAEPQV